MLLPQGETFVLHIKITMDANFVFNRFDGLRLVWEFRSFVFIWITNDISWQTLFRFWWMNCWWYMRCSNQIMLQLLDVIGILIYWYKQVFEILGNIVTYLQQKTVLIWFTERYRCSILMFHIPAIKIKYIQHCFFNNAYIIDNLSRDLDIRTSFEITLY